MDRLLMELVKRETPPTNRDVVDGLAVKTLPFAEQYIDQVFRTASRSFPPGLEYIKCERCTPQEEFNEVTRPKNNRRTVDIIRNDLYMVKYYFSYKGNPLPPRFIYLPFVGEAGTIYLSGSRYVISPVLSDKAISPGQNNVFIRLMRDKVIIERTHHSMVVNGFRETTQVVWSKLYRKSGNTKVAPTTKAETGLVHYLLCKYGASEMFRKFAHVDPVFGLDEINEDTYPPSEWVIFSSSQIKPKTFIGEFYKPTEIRIAIPKSKYNKFIHSLVAGFYYALDHFPSRVQLRYLNDTRLWMILLGHIIFSGVYGEGKLYTDVKEHFNSLDEYVDSLVSLKLAESGYPCSDFYELMAVSIENFSDWLLSGADQINAMYGKEMSVLYNVLFDITSSIFRTNFTLNKQASKKDLTDKELSEKEIIEIMNRNLTTGMIFSLTKKHVSVSTVGYSGDNKFFKITNIIVPQASSHRMTRSKKARKSVADPTKKLHVSIAEAGGYLNLPKSNPSGNARINPHVKLDERFTIIPDPRKRELIKFVDRKLKGL